MKTHPHTPRLRGFLCCLAAASLAFVPEAMADEMPAFKQGNIIVFQGDSITDGGRARWGDDHNHTMGQDYAYIISGWLGAQFPERHLTFLNRGIGGNRVNDLAARWQNDALNLKPDILSILIGINDSQAHTPIAVFEQIYDKLLADTVAALPHVRLILCTPLTLPVGKFKNNFDAWQGDVQQRSQVVERLANKYHAPVVRLQTILDEASKRAPAEYWLWDGIHPDYCAHFLLAEEWIRTVNSFYGK
jgi:lysophospholipase L1-like esterase